MTRRTAQIFLQIQIGDYGVFISLQWHIATLCGQENEKVDAERYFPVEKPWKVCLSIGRFPFPSIFKGLLTEVICPSFVTTSHDAETTLMAAANFHKNQACVEEYASISK